MMTSKGQLAPTLQRGRRWLDCMLVLRVSPAEAFGCLYPERIAAHRGVAVQCHLPAGSGVAAVQDVADSLEPGSAVAFLLVEHLWAGRVNIAWPAKRLRNYPQIPGR